MERHEYPIRYDLANPNWERVLSDKRAVDKEWGLWRADGELIEEIEWEVNEKGMHPCLQGGQ